MIIHNLSLLLLLFIFLSNAKARVWALRLPLQALIDRSGRDGGAEGGGKVVVIVKIILIDEVGGDGVSSSWAAGGAGQEVAHVGEGRRGRGAIVDDPAGVRASRGAAPAVQQGAGRAAGGRGGREHGRAFAITQLNRGDVVTWLGREE